MFQDEYKAKFDAIPPDPEFRRQLEERIDAMKAPHVNKRKLPAAAVAVLAALLILTTGALAASGTLGSIFHKINEDTIFAEGHTSELDFSKLSEIIDSPIQSAALTFSNGSSVMMNLEEAYYNGSQYALGWAMLNDRTQMQFIEKENFPYADSNRAVDDFPLWVTEEARAEFDRRFAEDGFACVSYVIAEAEKQLYAPEGLEFSQTIRDDRGEYTAMLVSEIDSERNMWEEGNILYMLDSNYRLPPSLADQDHLTVTRFVHGVVYYYYRDNTGSYTGYGNREWFPVTFTIQRSTEITGQSCTIDAVFPNHTAEIVVTVSPVQIDVKIVNNVESEWTYIYRSAGVPYFGDGEPMNLSEDIIVWYDTMIDGEPIEGGWSAQGPAGGEYYFAPPADAKTLTICPVYANTLQHMDEAIHIDLSTMTVISE